MDLSILSTFTILDVPASGSKTSNANLDININGSIYRCFFFYKFQRLAGNNNNLLLHVLRPRQVKGCRCCTVVYFQLCLQGFGEYNTNVGPRFCGAQNKIIFLLSFFLFCTSIFNLKINIKKNHVSFTYVILKQTCTG